ncbi:hypothetical protein SOVF_005840 [Spinacia oleracea]|nr:hypothetical protein SOVF_005840 [Spinacia oleracea]
MPTEAAEKRAVRAQQSGALLPPVEFHEPLPCPRCTSTNTKFCYYNNYNFSQPRHFCKSCRRYWTQGGTLRDIPVGGGSRKTAKRSRTCSVSSSPTSTSSALSIGPILDHNPFSQAPVYVSLSSTTAGGGGGGGGGGFTSLLSGGGGGPGLLALGGFGLGLGLDEVGFGLGRGVWAFPHHEIGSYMNGVNGGCGVGGDNGGGCGGGGGGGEGGGVSRSDTWHMESGEMVGYVGGEYFTSLPDLAAISTSGNGLK